MILIVTDGIDGVDFDQDGFASDDSGGDDCNDLTDEIHPNATKHTMMV